MSESSWKVSESWKGNEAIRDEFSGETFEEIHERANRLQREIFEEENRRIQEWELHRSEGPGATPGAPVRETPTYLDELVKVGLLVSAAPRRIYLAGPMSGIPQLNFPAFDKAAADLRSRGYDVVSPAELDDPTDRELALASPDGDMARMDKTWGYFLARDVRLIADEGIEAIVCMEGWKDSKGARLETFVGRLAALPIFEYREGHGLLEVSADDINKAHGIVGVGLSEPVLTGDDILDIDAAREARRATEEVRVTDPVTGGQKGQKLAQLGALDPLALLEVGKVAGFGAQKYDRLNYTKGFDWSLAFDALMRHALLFWNGEDVDEESGLPHIAHAAWQCLCLLTFMTRGRGTDDRIHQLPHFREASS